MSPGSYETIVFEGKTGAENVQKHDESSFHLLGEPAVPTLVLLTKCFKANCMTIVNSKFSR